MEHRAWERLDDRAEVVRSGYESGWPRVLGRFAAERSPSMLAMAQVRGDTALVPAYAPRMSDRPIPLGAFSVSLTVKDIGVSRAFYEKLGFTAFHGEQEQDWLIMRNGDATIGLFEGMFDRNILTFNPGWDADAKALDDFTDVRELQRRLEAEGIQIATRVIEGTTGPGHLELIDPDGNPILIDQHV